jgi:hypothetical protein
MTQGGYACNSRINLQTLDIVHSTNAYKGNYRDTGPLMLFTQRYHRVLENGTIEVEIPIAARNKIWAWLVAHNNSMGIQRDPNDRWISNSSILEEAELELLIEYGWQKIPGATESGNGEFHASLQHLVLNGGAAYVFDVIELTGRFMDQSEKEALRQKTNLILEMHDCAWRLSDGEFFKLDADFVGARLAIDAHDTLSANRFVGAADEFARARQYLASGEIRDAIYYAGHSFESVMKVLTGLENANADRLIKDLQSKGYFDDLPESTRAGFADQVLKTLPFLRNKLGGHGQGAAVLLIPSVYGDLAVQLAAVLHNFLISKHLERTPALPIPLEPKELEEDEVPF